MASGLEIINIEQWIGENMSSFLPPVCNKLMHGAGQLKVMFIGGPNQRKDYHIEEGEEFFYQLQGDMCLKVVEKDAHKNVHIRQGECYLHPSRIPHSPQRLNNTVGLVIERDRSKDETDGLRYYIDGTTDPLWEEWFYCYDLGTQLGPVIKKYFASDEHKTGRPPPGKVFPKPPVDIDVTTVTDKPFSMSQWISDHREEIVENGSKDLFNNGEFKIVMWGGGEQRGENIGASETFLWQMEGEAEVSSSCGSGVMNEQDSVLLKAGEKYTVCREPDSIGMCVTTNPLANKKK
ncbi:3-hydroxyanthranilate 3,4-dioxygenase-like [Halichondria panicea]|uniref:3-hydroxyanthranilate 3,4-dioxygenase-like n=1 Tax=Halichondria panicea TaxID=6063 RepID=UPI00312BB407